MDDRYTENPDGTYWSHLHPRPDHKTEVIATTLYEAQCKMPSGQSFNLYSWGACLQLANKVSAALSLAAVTKVSDQADKALTDSLEEDIRRSRDGE